MTVTTTPIFLGDTPLKQRRKNIKGEYVTFLGELFYKIENFDAMAPFFMTIVSSSDHWLFISSNGAITAGRGNSDRALFPYYTEDKITDSREYTGSKTILLVNRKSRTSLWQPFSDHQQGQYAIARNLYKNISGTALVFEENNLDLGLTFRYAWRTSERFGFVKTCWIINNADSPCQVELLDGLQNILPANISEQTQNTFSCLLDAYKRSEVDSKTGLAIYFLNSRMTDKAEPSESLQATTVAQVGLPQADYLISAEQLDRFCSGDGIVPETENRGLRGAYFAHTTFELDALHGLTWHILADVQQDCDAIGRLGRWLKGDHVILMNELETDIAAGQLKLWKMVARVDGVQLTGHRLATSNHFANVMFNLMRGGVFADQYWISTTDFIKFVHAHSRELVDEQAGYFSTLPARIHVSDLLTRAAASGVADLVRLSASYLPLIFSRRHGDPSRPWNRFSINLKNPDGSMKLDYEGNWRDIFQNWEALAWSYPEYTESMICTFLNATTPDGYNPYRITLHGIEWEVPDPGNPWSNIGYWSDHQVIYLLKLMEMSDRFHPGRLGPLLTRSIFSYANVPYRLKPYQAILEDPHNTIEFDWQLHRDIEEQVRQHGSDARLLSAPGGGVLHANLAEKLLTLFLAKLVNFVPEGGIWMNTQRPEWNDANNALVGKGLSVVTLCYLRRALAFCRELLGQSHDQSIPIHVEVHSFFTRIMQSLESYRYILFGSFTDDLRREVMDALGAAGNDFRSEIYKSGFSGKVVALPMQELVDFIDTAQQYIEHSLRANRRSDGMYHAYNILHLDDRGATIGHLFEMLEGQVAILSSGMLSAGESLKLLQALRASSLYRTDQQSFILYPDRDLPGFLKKNSLDNTDAQRLRLFTQLAEAQDRTLVTRDIDGVFHFSGHIRNIQDINDALMVLESDQRFAGLVKAESEEIRRIFEAMFHHDEFTGRSGTFFAYEGLGSVYWHMVSKLLLAVQETALRFGGDSSVPGLVEIYKGIRRGLGFNKSPAEYGAFPTDPYSHTPKGRGAQQPGMTGMVKEAILTRQAELGLLVKDGGLVFTNVLVESREFLSAPAEFSYLDVQGDLQRLSLDAGSLAFTVCQTPVVLIISGYPGITIHYTDGSLKRISEIALDAENSHHIFLRDGVVHYLEVRCTLG